MGTSDEGQGPPAPFRLIAPGVLEMRGGGGCIALFGAPFFLGGIFLALAAIGLVPMQPGANETRTRLGLPFMSAVFLIVGGAMVFGRRWVTLDIATGRVIQRAGLLVPMHTRERRLGDFNAVVADFSVGDSETQSRYPVRLRAMEGKDFTLTTPTQFGESRRQAEYLSRFLHMPLVDNTTPHFEAVRAPAVRPSAMRSQVQESAAGVTVVLPGKSRKTAVFAAAIFSAVFLIGTYAILGFFRGPGSPRGAEIFLLVILAIPVIRLALMRPETTTVSASPAGITIMRRTGRRTRTTSVAPADILDIECSDFADELETARHSSGIPAGAPGERTSRILGKIIPGRGIVVKSRQELMYFGNGLPGDELRYLRDLLRKALAGG